MGRQNHERSRGFPIEKRGWWNREGGNKSERQITVTWGVGGGSRSIGDTVPDGATNEAKKKDFPEKNQGGENAGDSGIEN